MTDIDPAAVVREKQALKDALSYRSLHHDTDLVLEDTERGMFAEANRRWSRFVWGGERVRARLLLRKRRAGASRQSVQRPTLPGRGKVRSSAPTSRRGAALRSDRALLDVAHSADPRGVLLSAAPPRPRRSRRGRGIQKLRSGSIRAGHQLADQARSPRRGQADDRGAERAARRALALPASSFGPSPDRRAGSSGS